VYGRGIPPRWNRGGQQQGKGPAPGHMTDITGHAGPEDESHEDLPPMGLTRMSLSDAGACDLKREGPGRTPPEMDGGPFPSTGETSRISPAHVL